jgi:ABC-type glycerol-3-phosphate transport system permease component
MPVSERRSASGVLLNVGLAGLALLTVVPFVIMLSWSFKTQGEIFQRPFSLIPESPTLDNYLNLFTQRNFSYFVPNSIFAAVGYTLLGLFCCSLGGWALAHYRTRLNTPLTIVLIALIAVPFQALAISEFLLVTNLRLVNTLWALIIPFAASPYGILFMRQYMLSLPAELFEAARLDGASELRIFRSVVLPLVRPALGALTVFLFLDSWNDFLWPLIAIQQEKNLTIPVGTSSLVGLFKLEYGQIMAASALAIVPVAVILFVLQRQFVAGLTAGAVRR